TVKMMRAVQALKYGGPEVLQINNIAIPKPKKGEVLIKVHFAGINPIDALITSGFMGTSGPLPLIPGMDTAGVVEEVGDGVKDFKKGDRVYTVATDNGAYAQYTVTTPKHIAHLQPSLTFAQGAAIGVPYYTAWKSLYFRAQAKSKETILVHGASGAVGIAAVQIAKANGHLVIGTAGTKEGLDLVKKVGADFVFNHRQEGYLDEIQKATKGAGVNVILEMLANVNLDKDLDLLAQRGRVVVVGCRDGIRIEPAKTMFKETSILGVALLTASDEEWQEIKNGVENLQKKGKVQPIVSREYKLSEVAQAFTEILKNSGTLGKFVLDTSK
ncbi:quinone oxidoreductase, partial [Biomphalaria glabrata]